MFDFLCQIFGVLLFYLDDLSLFDYEFYKNVVIWIQENSVNDLDLFFSVDVLNLWNFKFVIIDFIDDSDKKFIDDNKVCDNMILGIVFLKFFFF